MNKKELAVKYHDNNFNCCQSILLAYKEIFNIDSKDLVKLSEGFGLGVSKAYSICGALQAIIMINSYLISSDNTKVGGLTKQDTYNKNEELIKEFNDIIGSINCLDIKGIKTNKPLTSCNNCIEVACDIINKRLK